ncbi:DUF523 domain-containing protein [Iodobacter fluviatilis]|uniref:Uncharacterized conserved protein n=1 Tax=Iodobacter fluviatilis TaxID=537 RepID=A0A377Q2T6_9NEIS|nr:DUF523 domain-containing protein [Iodobacter fluviatilis]TCU90110.1 uncharacterized protein YbbK (DUF523 family) [Iodobacter fluviatilis]STQ89137.1 Uncharacterized conserved protein [Iodobacter fluviatilis]
MQYVLVSACLLGRPVRYNGVAAASDHPLLAVWNKEGRLIVVCPEVAAGLPVPRPPAEIMAMQSGWDVLQGKAQVLESSGRDVSRAFVSGAKQALAVAKGKNIQIAILKEGSPSCGSSFIYDGSFTGTKHPQAGVTATLLQDAGIRVFSELELDEAAAYLKGLEAEISNENGQRNGMKITE